MSHTALRIDCSERETNRYIETEKMMKTISQWSWKLITSFFCLAFLYLICLRFIDNVWSKVSGAFVLTEQAQSMMQITIITSLILRI